MSTEKGLPSEGKEAAMVRSRNPGRIASAVALLVLALLAGSVAGPSGGLVTAATATSPTATPSAIQTLPDWILKYIAVDVSVSSIYGIMGYGSVTLGDAEYRLSGGGTVRFEYSDRVQDMPIFSRIQVEGKPDVVPVHDAKPVDDFRIPLGGGLALAPHDEVTVQRLTDVLGDPVNDVTTVNDSLFEEPRSLERHLDFIGVEVTLRQPVEGSDKSRWSVAGIEFSTPAYASPRGLKVGMALAEVQRRFGTDEMSMYVDGSKDGLYAMGIGKNMTYMDWEGPVIGVLFLDDEVVDWSIGYAKAT